MPAAEIPIQERVRTFLYEVAEAKRSQPDYEAYLKAQLKRLTEAELHELRTQVESSAFVPEMFRTPGPERLVILKLSHERLDELKNSIIEKGKKAINDAMPANWSPQTKKAVGIGLAAGVGIVGLLVIREFLKSRHNEGVATADAGTGGEGFRPRLFSKWMLVQPALYALGFLGLGYGVYRIWGKMDAFNAKLHEGQLAMAQAAFNNVTHTLGRREHGGRGARFRTLFVLENELNVGTLGQLRGPDVEKMFLEKNGFKHDTPSAIETPGPSAVVKYRIAYDPGTKKFTITEVVDEGILKVPAALTVKHLPAVHEKLARDTKVNEGVLVSLITDKPDVMKITMDKILDDALKPPVKIGDAAVDNHALFKDLPTKDLKTAMLFLVQSALREKDIGVLKRRFKMDDAENDKEIKKLTLEQYLAETGQAIRTIGNVRQSFKRLKPSTDVEYKQALEEAFDPTVTFELEADIPRVRAALQTLDPKMAGREARFMHFCSGKGKSMISLYDKAWLDGDAELTLEDRNVFHTVLEKFKTDPMLDAKRQLTRYASILEDGKGIVGCKAAVADIQKNLTVADIVQLSIYTFEATPTDKSLALPNNNVGVGRCQTLLKFAELTARQNPPLGKTLFDALKEKEVES